jgi:2-amino-4-hydroxy-6-hydroxymethyldihydropteridine diphosphokinase
MRSAARELSVRFPGIRFSSVYRSVAMDVTDQPDFLNAVAVVETERAPQDIADELRRIETTLKKAPPYRYGPRTIDLDILLYGDSVLPSIQEWNISNISELTSQNSQLIIPHPRMHQRRFVLEPLVELIDSQALHPVLHRSWKELLIAVEEQTVRSKQRMDIN